MKILQIFNRYRFNGGEEGWVETIPQLLEGSADVQNLYFNSSDWTSTHAPSKFKQIILMGDNPASRKKLKSHVDRFQPDILLFHNVIPVGSFGLYFEAKSLGIPVLNYTHNFRPFSPSGTLWNGRRAINDALRGNPWPEIAAGSWQNSRIKTAILAWHLNKALADGLLNCVNHWIAISEFMCKNFIKAGVPEEKISVLKHCCHASLAPTSISGDSHYLFLGRLVAEKGLESLIQAWKLLYSSQGKDCPKLVIAGNGPLERMAIDAAASIPQIHYTGFVKGGIKTDLLIHSKAVMVPSIWWEPLGLTTYESYAHMRPVIASRVGGLLETVQDGLTGWHHEAGNADDLAKTVMKAENAGAKVRNQRGKQGYQWLRTHADPASWKKSFMEICNEL